MLRILTIILALAASPAMATVIGNTTNNNQTYGGAATANGGNATQGQIQGQIGINKNETNVITKTDIDNKNTNVNGAVSGSKSKSNSNSKSSSNQSQDASSANSISIGGDTFTAAKIPVNSAYAPTILPTSDCLSSVSGGATNSFFSGAFGFSYAQEDCNRRSDSAHFKNLGLKDVAIQRMCQGKKNREAMEDAGYLCANSNVKKVKAKQGGFHKSMEEECKYPTAACQNYKKIYN